MQRTKTYSAFNPFFHIEEDTTTLEKYRRADLFINDLQILSESLLSYKLKNTFSFRLNRVLQDLYLLSQTPPPTGVLVSFALESVDTQIKKLTIKTANFDNTNTNATDYTVLLGKIHPEKFLANHTLLSNNIAIPLTNLTSCRLVGEDQPVFLYALITFDLTQSTTPSLNIIANFEFTDGSIFTQTIATEPTTLNNTIYKFQSTINLLVANLPTAQQALILANCTLSFALTIGTETQNITPDTVLIPDYQYYPDAQTLIYLNPFGLYECIRFTGQITRENEIFSESILNQGNETNISSRFRKKISLQLAIDNAQNTEAIIDDLSYSNAIYWQQSSNLIPLVKDFRTLKSFDSTTQNDSPTLDFRLPYEY
jgi:hypothetical protein